ncbi:MAG TPA: cation diffusion facilitator family transporter [Chitinispirillaceae bacterium]|nr:cation diffusion facilitator family transporter [Chitinispirillaceae bacterium]
MKTNHNNNNDHDNEHNDTTGEVRPCGGQEIHQHVWNTGYKRSERGKLLLSIGVTGIIMVIEVAGGILSHSIALLSDAGHMFTHLFALIISYIAIRLVTVKPSMYRTFGLYRLEVVASLVNSLFLFGVTVLIVYESVERIIFPREIASTEMFIVAVIGLIANVVTILILESSHHHDRNIHSALMHMVADLLSSVAVVAGAVVIYFTKWTIVDPLAGILISLLIVHWSWKLFKDAMRVILEIAPSHIPPNEVRELLKKNDPRIKAITDMHIVEITSGMYNFSAHIEISGDSPVDYEDVINKINGFLKKTYCIDHTTIQVTRQYP